MTIVTVSNAPGLSAFESWRAQPGNAGKTEAEFFVSLIGATGPVPNHQWLGTALRFELPSGQWGVAVDLRGAPGLTPGHEWNGTQLRFQNSDLTWGNYVELKGLDGDVTNAALNAALAGYLPLAGGTVTGGVLADEQDLGLSSVTGAITPVPGSRTYQKMTNDAAFQINGSALAAGKAGSLRLKIVNAATAGAVTLAGFLKTDGGTITTVNGDSFFVYMEFDDTGATATVQARQ